MNAQDIRNRYLQFFEERGHKIIPRALLTPKEDATTLFTGSGMQQLMPYLLGQDHPEGVRLVDSQTCLRAQDIDDVGDNRHTTFFEMLGNFSFGDYFKREAIKFAWQFLTEELKLPEEKLWVTVYEKDDEAAEIWLKEMGVSSERFSRCGEKDNFWSMGDTGPCGSCSEIFYDHGDHIWGGPPGTPEEDGDRYVEIWNLVFMQYDRNSKGELTPLPNPSVDTGMGLERIAAVMQGVHNNYDIDIFVSLIDAIYQLTSDQDRQHASFKVVADHIRSCAFLILDGVLPGNEGRGYVLRRIIRRAVRHGHKLGLTDQAFFYKLVQPLCDVMGMAYPELIEQQAHIEKILQQEESQFLHTLSHGLKLLEGEIAELTTGEISGEVAFKLFDTYGFPFDLTADIARERDLVVDQAGFDAAMARRKEESRSNNKFTAAAGAALQLDMDSRFTGYQHTHDQGIIAAIINEQGEQLSEMQAGMTGLKVVLDQTPFYAESGGQIGDTGTLLIGENCFDVTDTQKLGSAIIHIGEMRHGKLSVNDSVEAIVDNHRRDAIRLNHSATHLVHAALKKVLGNHVQQKGSLVTDDKARFDFSHYQAMSKEELYQVESLVNQQIRLNHLVITEEMSYDQAQTSGAVALFGEKYGDTVRVLSMGEFSKELCGGTHVSRTGDIGFCRVVHETGTASGIRRIEFVTGERAQLYTTHQEKLLVAIGEHLHTAPVALLEKIEGMISHQKQLEKETDRLKAKIANASSSSLLDKVESFGEYKLLVARLDGCEPKSLRTTLDGLKDKLQNAAVVLVAVNDNKMNVVAGLSKSAIGKLPDAKVLVQKICGKGGGRADMAQGGGLLVDDLEARFELIKQDVRSAIGCE